MNDTFPLKLALKKQAGPLSDPGDGRQMYRDPRTGKWYMVEELKIKVTHATNAA